MEQELEKIIRDKNFTELSAEDKVVLSDLIHSEEEFDVVKQIFATAPTLNDNITPSSKLKKSLMETFVAQHADVTSIASATVSRKTKIILFRSIAAVAAIFISFMLLFPFGDDKGIANFTADNEVNKANFANKKEGFKIVTKQIEEIDSMVKHEMETIAPIQESSVQVAVNNSLQRASGSNLNRSDRVLENEFSSSVNFVAETNHSDRLSSSDLPENNKQVVQENPSLLDVLYTAF